MQVRSIAAYEAPDGRTLLLSGSRDQTARLWVQQADGTYTSSSLGEERAGFVNAVAFAHDDAGRRTCGAHALWRQLTWQCMP